MRRPEQRSGSALGAIWGADAIPNKDRAWWAAMADDLSYELGLPFVVAESVMLEEWEVVCRLDGGLEIAVCGFNDRELSPRLDWYRRVDRGRYNGSLDAPRVRLGGINPYAARSHLLGWICDALELLRMLGAVRS